MKDSTLSSPSDKGSNHHTLGVAECNTSRPSLSGCDSDVALPFFVFLPPLQRLTIFFLSLHIALFQKKQPHRNRLYVEIIGHIYIYAYIGNDVVQNL